jgi:hypothetical protein
LGIHFLTLDVILHVNIHLILIGLSFSRLNFRVTASFDSEELQAGSNAMELAKAAAISSLEYFINKIVGQK